MSYTELIKENLKETINERNGLNKKYQNDINKYRVPNI